MSVAEMEQIAARDRHASCCSRKSRRAQEQSIRAQARRLPRPTSAPRSASRGAKLPLPKGVVTRRPARDRAARLTKAKGYQRFDELPIPFRAVATDLVTGKAVVFSEGELANVMRASMSVPGAVAPAEFDGMMLVDGGSPATCRSTSARAMGADIVIAVNVGTPLLKREAAQLRSSASPGRCSAS